MRFSWSSSLLVLLLPLVLLGDARPPPPKVRLSATTDAFAALRETACGAESLRRVARDMGQEACSPALDASLAASGLRPAIAARRPFAAVPVATGDGTLVGRQRLFTSGTVAVDLVAYQSSNLIVGGLFCFVDDGQPRTTVLHLHGGLGGIFVKPDGGDIVSTCFNWAALNGRNAFVPSFRGQDGSQGQPELCLGEADDVAAAAVFLRGQAVVDPNRMALVGGSMGGCVALKASVKIPNLRAVVAIAPPMDWKDFVTYNRTAYQPAVETRCDGTKVTWNDGGPTYADTVDDLICGHPGCSDSDYIVRSPVLDAASATNPTLVLVAGADNLVPPQQQLLWSIVRVQAGHAITPAIVDRCSGITTPPLAQDVLMFIPGAFHQMENPIIISSLVYLSDLLDAATPPAHSGL